MTAFNVIEVENSNVGVPTVLATIPLSACLPHRLRPAAHTTWTMDLVTEPAYQDLLDWLQVRLGLPEAITRKVDRAPGLIKCPEYRPQDTPRLFGDRRDPLLEIRRIVETREVDEKGIPHNLWQ
jgi:hypothetical protein